MRPKQGLVHGPVVLVALASLTKITRPYMGIAAASVAQDNWIAVSPCPLCAHIVYGDCWCHHQYTVYSYMGIPHCAHIWRLLIRTHSIFGHSYTRRISIYVIVMCGSLIAKCTCPYMAIAAGSVALDNWVSIFGHICSQTGVLTIVISQRWVWATN